MALDPHLLLTFEDLATRLGVTPKVIRALIVAGLPRAERMSKAHRSITCDQCGLWTVWLPIKETNAVEKWRIKQAKLLHKRAMAHAAKIVAAKQSRRVKPKGGKRD